VFGTFNLVSARMLDAVKAQDFEEVLNAFGKVSGSGWGVDLGLDYVKRKGNNLLTMGFSIVDAYTNLNTDSNDAGKKVQGQPLKANFGASYLIKQNSFGVRLAADVRNLEDFEQSVQKRLKLGTELILSPVFSAFGGLNSGQYSYGIKLNLGVFQTYAGLYGVDTGEKIGQQVSRRAVIYLSLFDFNYDI